MGRRLTLGKSALSGRWRANLDLSVDDCQNFSFLGDGLGGNCGSFGAEAVGSGAVGKAGSVDADVELGAEHSATRGESAYACV